MKFLPATLAVGLALGVLACSGLTSHAQGAPAPNHATLGWKTPFPPYPADARRAAEQGQGKIRARAGAKGRVVEVTIIKSTGSRRLDEATVAFVRAHWEGPPNSEYYAVLNYRLKRRADR